MNKKNLTLPLFVIASFFGNFSIGQKLPSTLLWKISGNGLQKPSYLYGTMHLTDKKIFNLGDSLYKAIEKSDGLAIEIDPQAFTSIIIDEAKKNVYNDGAKLKDVMPREKFKKYGKSIAKKLGKNEDELTKGDIRNEKDKLIRQTLQKGKMKTFLDIYLLDIARREGKWIGGVEDAYDQEGLDDVTESDIEQFAEGGSEEDLQSMADESTNILKNAYINNDLNAIDSISNLQDSLVESKMLFKRNIKMARRMDSLAMLRSMVFAVGAAHLPGQKGLISLLREKGFTVTPVFSSRKIKPSDYKVAEVPLKWFNIKDEDSLYTAAMPGKAGDMSFYGLFHMKIYFDVFSCTMYMTAGFKTPYSQSVADSMFIGLTTNFFGISDFSKGKPVIVNNVKGMEFVANKERFGQGYFLYDSGRMFVAVALSLNSQTADKISINRFLHSFTIFKMPSRHSENVFSNETGAYRIIIPGPAQSADDLVGKDEDSTLIRKAYFATDPQTGAYFFFGINEAAPGYYIPNDSLFLAGIEHTQKSKFNQLNTDTLFEKDGIRYLDLEGPMKQAPLNLKAHFQTRGNRCYSLVALYDPAKDNSSVSQFFNSFDTLAYTSNSWNKYGEPNKIFSTWAPSSFQYKAGKPTQIEEVFDKYISYDSSRGDDFEVTIQKYSKYYWEKNDSTLWKQVLDLYTSNASLLYKKPVKNGKVKGLEIEVKRNGASNIKRLRFFLNGNELVTLLTSQFAAEINNENNNKFFDSFRVKNPQPTTDLFESKAALILKDVASPDSATRSEATYYLNLSPFSKEDLPLLHQAVLKNYPSNSSAGFDVIKNDLKQIIINLKDSSSFTFAKNNYLSADDTTQKVLLAIMASSPTKEHFNEIKNILLNHTPSLEPGYDFILGMTDSIQLTAAILPDLLPLIKDSVMAGTIIKLANKSLDSGVISKEVILPYEDILLNLAAKDLNRLKSDRENYLLSDYDMADLLGNLNSVKSNSMLHEWSDLTQSYIRWKAVNLLLQNKQSVTPQAIDSVAKDQFTRIQLYDSLKAMNKTDLFPVAYLSQEKIGESLAYISVEDDDPTAITYLSDTVVNFKGRASRFYFYKIAVGDGDDMYFSLGCAGPFDLSKNNLKLNETFGDVYYDDDYDPSVKDQQMKAVLKQMEEGFKWLDQEDDKKDE